MATPEPSYYTLKYSGEELDAAIAKANARTVAMDEPVKIAASSKYTPEEVDDLLDWVKEQKAKAEREEVTDSGDSSV